EETILVKLLEGRELVALAEESFKVFLRDVAVPGRHVHHQFRRPLVTLPRLPQFPRLRFGLVDGGVAIAVDPLADGLADQPFHQAAIEHGRTHDFTSSSAPAISTRTAA